MLEAKLTHPLCRMAALLASSRRRVLTSPATAILLDVLAPAAFSTLSLHSSVGSSPKARIPSNSTASTSKVRLEDTEPSKPTRKQKKQNRIASGQPPARVQRGQPPNSNRSPSAVDLLSKIRNSTSSNATSSDPVVQGHNEAVMSIVRGTKDPRRDFVEAFKKGWIPIRNAGQVGRLQAKDLAKVLRTCTLAERNGKKEEVGYQWSQVRGKRAWSKGI